MPRRCHRSCIFIAALVSVTLIASPPLAGAATFHVNSTADLRDQNPGDGVCTVAPPLNRCTLRAAIQEANATSGGPHTIFLGAATYTLALAGADEDAAFSGDLDVTEGMTIQGLGADSTVIDGAQLDRVFHVHLTSLTLEKLTVTGGWPPNTPGVFPGGSHLGGGILVDDGASLRLTDTRVSGNRANVSGSAVFGYRPQEIEIIDSDIGVNRPLNNSGGNSQASAVFATGGNAVGCVVEILGSTIRDTRCEMGGGGTCTAAGLKIHGCTSAPGTGLIMRNSTVSGNEGSGIILESTNGLIENSTIYDNGRYGFYVNGSAPHFVKIANTIIAKGGIADCILVGDAWDADREYNLSSDESCQLDTTIGDIENTDPELHELGYHRPDGSHIAPVHSPIWDSVVVDRGQDLVSVTDDQYDRPRPMDGNKNGIASHDIGAVEVWPCITDTDLVVDEDIDTGDLLPSPGSIAKQACRSISTSGSVQVTSSDGHKVRFWARDFVALDDGFTVTADSEFIIDIVPWAGVPL